MRRRSPEDRVRPVADPDRTPPPTGGRRRRVPEPFGSAWSFLGWALGPRRRRLLPVPFLALGLALSETLMLVIVVRLMLLLVDGGSDIQLTVAGLELQGTFAQLAVIATIAGVINIGLRVVLSQLLGTMCGEAIAGAQGKVLRAWFAADWQHVRSARLGQLQQLTGLNSTAAAGAVTAVTNGTVALLSLVIYSALVIVSAPSVALMFGVVGGLTALTLNPFRSRARKLSRRSQAALIEIQLNATSYAQLNRELHVFGVTQSAVTALEEQASKARVIFSKMRSATNLLSGAFQQVLLLGVVGVLVVARWIDLDAAAFGTAAVLAIRSVGFLQQYNSVTTQYIEQKPFLDEAQAVTAERTAERATRGTVPLQRIRAIELAGVGYTYDGEVDALSDVSLEVHAGEWIGVVGPSGGGKTTLVHVIAGLLSPTTGDYTVNGRLAREFDDADFRRQFALLTQEPALLRASVEDNIRFHREIPDAVVREAAEAAAIASDLDELPRGFETLLGDGYASLSGGQRQRLALARALAGRPSVLLLDEPTSALDAANEALVGEALNRVPDDVIVLVATHRPALLQHCHRIFEIEDGRLVERQAPRRPAAR